jgi:SAM-dependent methyltransferase
MQIAAATRRLRSLFRLWKGPAERVVSIRPPLASVPPFPGRMFRSLEEYRAYVAGSGAERERRRTIEEGLIAEDEREFDVEGYCAVCGAVRQFHVSFLYAYLRTETGRLVPNWREHLVCQCGFGNRVRASLHMFLSEPATREAAVFITEQTTPLYSWLKDRYPNTVGSEYFGPGLIPGSTHGAFRHEDLMCLSFPDDSFDIILSFDVLEHVADSDGSFRECLRCLKPGGVMLFTAPFTINEPHNTIRAVQRPDGSIEHLAPPEYHGNPIDPDGGSLCFRYFSWEMLETMAAIGFKDPRAIVYWSRELGYLGGDQVLFVASKPSPSDAGRK